MKTYRRPQNAGKQINTEGDEFSPYYDMREGKLYFSSDGWRTLGGFDVFSAKGGPSRYTTLDNLGYPINTSADEIYYVMDPSGKPDAYVVSNRVGSKALKNPTCCDDIWRIQYEPNLFAHGKVLDQNNQELVGEVVVKMVDEDGTLNTFNSTDGKFEFRTNRGHNYVITADKSGYASTRVVVNTTEIPRTAPDDTVFVTIYLDEVNLNNTFKLVNIQYEYDDANIMPESAAELEKLIQFLNDNKSLEVEIHAHTDNKGDDKYNMTLSQRRAESVVNYLVNSGIEKSRLTAKGFGETKPIAQNNLPNGKDNPEGRALNRRTEFKIMNDVPTRRLIYDSNKPGTFGEQSKNLEVDPESMGEEGGSDAESEYGKPGSRVNK